MLKKLLNLEQSRFVIVGVLNTLIGTTVMFVAYNVGGCGYWISSALNYIVGSIFSYFANKYFTFRTHDRSLSEMIRFILNIIICYAIAYGVAKPIINMLLEKSNLSLQIKEQIGMLLGMCIFVVVNFFGQKFFVFHAISKKYQNNSEKE